MTPAKMAKSSAMPLGLDSCEPKKHILDEVHIPTGRGNFEDDVGIFINTTKQHSQ